MILVSLYQVRFLKKIELKFAIFTVLAAHFDICGSSSQLELDFYTKISLPIYFCTLKGQNLNQ